MKCYVADYPDPPPSHPQTSSYCSHTVGNTYTSPERKTRRRIVRGRSGKSKLNLELSALAHRCMPRHNSCNTDMVREIAPGGY